MDFSNLEKDFALVSKSIIFSPHLVFYRWKARHLCDEIIQNDGSIDVEKINSLIKNWPSFSSLGLTYQDAHILDILKKLSLDKSFQKKITQFDLPISPDFERFVKLALNLTHEPISKTVLRRAVLASCLGYLRQTVGSCFATAPCLYILSRHPEYFLDDLFLMSKKNSLERLSGGQLIAVPMALSIGEHFLDTVVQTDFLDDSVYLYFKTIRSIPHELKAGQTLKECLGGQEGLNFYNLAYDPLLKIWEYTVASFCDAKGEFSESTLYLTLGLDSKIPEGLGEFFNEIFQKKLDQKHLLLVEAQNEAYLAHQRLVMAEGMAKNATTEASFQRSKSEIIAANYQLHSRQLDIDDAKKEQQKIQNLYETKMHLLKDSIGQFFQESYDPDLVSMKSYSEDAPAGFRLFVKEGQLSSRFRAIHNEDEFLQALKRFFEKIENELLMGQHDKDNQTLISHVITETIQFSSSKHFLEKTYERAKKRHPRALPWAYVSGGTLETLLKVYFRKEILKIQKIEADDVNQCLILLVDYFKSLPETHLEPFRLNPALGLLLETKTHACQIIPGNAFFKSFWESSQFTYTDIRDRLLIKGKAFYDHHMSETVIDHQSFLKYGKNYPTQRLKDFLIKSPDFKERFFIASAFLFSLLKSENTDKECGYCIIGDTNWTYSHLVIGYHPIYDKLCIFAQDPLTYGLLEIDNMEKFPQTWKIYEDLARVEMFIPGIRI
jgi:hypothetical protein